jgi:predicted ATPase
MSVALELSKELSHAFSHVYALTFAAWLEQFKGSLEDCGRLADAAIANAKEQGFPLLLGMALVVKGWTLSAAGDVATGLETVREGISLYQSTGAELGMPAMLAILSITTAQSGDGAKGLKTAVQALQLTDRHHEHLFKAELHRLIAELSLEAAARLPKSAHSQMRKQAKQAAMLAMVTASSQKAGTLMLRAALTSLRVAKTTRDRVHALGELTDVCTQFTASSSLQELQQARRIISQATS